MYSTCTRKESCSQEGRQEGRPRQEGRQEGRPRQEGPQEGCQEGRPQEGCQEGRQEARCQEGRQESQEMKNSCNLNRQSFLLM